MRRGVAVRLAAAAALGSSILFLVAWPVLAQIAGGQEIASAGPLTRIIVSETLNCQVAHRDDEQLELYGGEFGSCGTFLALGGVIYGPAATGATQTPWTPVGQTKPSASQIASVVDAGVTGVRVQQVDSYSVGAQNYRTDITITNGGAAAITGALYRAGDCYLQNSDTGYGRVDNGAPACIVNPAEGRRIEQWTPITPGSHYVEGRYSDVYSLINGEQFPDTCACSEAVDNGAGLSWPVSLAPGQSAVFSHEMFFSPTGRGPASFTESVPDPTKITLDPVVVAQSVAIAAGVILLVPFPSALFNSTLEENYDEVMAGIARLRAWIGALGVSLLTAIRQFVASRRTASGAPPPPAVPAEEQPLVAPIAVAQSAAPAAPSAAPRGERDFWSTPVGIGGFVLLSALLYAFLDPSFGISVESIAIFAGLALGLCVVLAAYGVPLLLLSRDRKLPLVVRALPATLLIGVICVLISRFTDFQPGYLYGLIVGFLFAAGVQEAEEGRAKAIAAGASLLVAFVAWVLLAVLRGIGGAGAELATTFIEAAAVTTVVAGLENAVFAMLPLRFLPGAAVFKWDRRVWAVLIGLGIFGFAHVLLNPAAGAGYMADTSRTSFFTLLLLLIGFGIASVIFWAWFRYRSPRTGTPAAPPPATARPAP